MDPSTDAIPETPAEPTADPALTEPTGDEPTEGQGEGGDQQAAPEKKPETSELVRVAKAERKADREAKRAEAAEKELATLRASSAELREKHDQFQRLAGEGRLIEAAELLHPLDAAKREKAYFDLQDWWAARPDDEVKAAEPTVEERAAKAAREAIEADKKAADEKAKADRDAELKAADEALEKERGRYTADARKVLAGATAEYPTVTARILSGELSDAKITEAAEKIGAAVLAQMKGQSEAEIVKRLTEETHPEAVLAALEASLNPQRTVAAATAASTNGAPTGSASPSLAEIEAEAIAEATRQPRRSTTISSSWAQGAAPVTKKPVSEMTMDEIDAEAIAEALASRRAPRAAG